MKLMSWLTPLAALLLLAGGYRVWGWPGVALASGGLVMWLLLHINRTMQALQRASRQPIGHVGSAVMLNARLKAGVTLLHVIALTRSLGQLLSAKDEQPERYLWTDAGNSSVRCEFRDGKLVHWELRRPDPTSVDGDGPAPP
jgi:hypothetical protein